MKNKPSWSHFLWPPNCYSALYTRPKKGFFRKIIWRAKHTHLFCLLTISHVIYVWKSRPLAVWGKPWLPNIDDIPFPFSVRVVPKVRADDTSPPESTPKPDPRPRWPFVSCGIARIYPRGLICFSREGDCMRTYMQNIRKKDRRPINEPRWGGDWLGVGGIGSYRVGRGKI